MATGAGFNTEPLPAINLKGCCLGESGFITEIPVVVTVERVRIVIETDI
ncbi:MULTISPECIES: SymE family type I addiction module toxin [unclassified Brenneria]|nr:MULTISPECIES: SymE family type I addiction module toxin [unclassified Brenneria]MDX5630816.1 SymE family type I addiction module toxin [Brenneria sp. L3-3Z]MDX5697898.1 SymE family type I addiction module toxin [Brenneria sp. L4-2C]